jgi:hypothetical protein
MEPRLDIYWIAGGIAGLLVLGGMVLLYRWYRQQRQRTALIAAIAGRGSSTGTTC